MSAELPEFREWSLPAVWLLKGVVYADDERVWNLLLSNTSQLETYFARLGLRLVITEADGLAYLRQLSDEEVAGDYASLPKLFRASPLTYKQTLLCVLLRDEMRRFEDDDLTNERCVVDEAVLLEQWKPFFPAVSDEVTLRKDLLASLAKLEDLGLIREFARDSGAASSSWEIRRILKARLPAAELERLRQTLDEHSPGIQAQ